MRLLGGCNSSSSFQKGVFNTELILENMSKETNILWQRHTEDARTNTRAPTQKFHTKVCIYSRYKPKIKENEAIMWFKTYMLWKRRREHAPTNIHMHTCTHTHTHTGTRTRTHTHTHTHARTHLHTRTHTHTHSHIYLQRTWATFHFLKFQNANVCSISSICMGIWKYKDKKPEKAKRQVLT